MGCATGTVKYLVFLFNFLVSMVGLALVVIGTIFFIKIRDLTSELDDKFLRFPPIFLIALGCVVFCIAFLGCCGAIQESSCMLVLYAIILLVLFAIQIAIGVYSFVSIQDQDQENSFNKSTEKSLQNIFDKYNTNNVSKIYFDDLQLSIECCGVKSKADWKNDLPFSCCENGKEGQVCKQKDAFELGCAPKLSNYFVSHSEMFGYVAIGLCVTELVASIFALCLRSSIHNEYRRSGYA